ncbi:hypothetical protein [Dickeya zeae]|uniref:hypothetical protein n=1 Tax=Dickeya zeae TaxID=204042 RepID=UPI0014433275|nr:hypothetical protein [Dickeya zeae]
MRYLSQVGEKNCTLLVQMMASSALWRGYAANNVITDGAMAQGKHQRETLSTVTHLIQ